jgi:hypothetical protein
VRFVSRRTSLADSVREHSVEFDLHLKSGLNKGYNLVNGIRAVHEFRAGANSRLDFSWQAVTEVPQGKAPIDGGFTLNLTRRNGEVHRVVGEFTADSVSGTWTAPNGTSRSFVRAR